MKRTWTIEQMCPGIEPVGNEFRFLVKSTLSKNQYVVDLTAYSGHGRCTCPDFGCRHNPRLRDGARPGVYTSCKHIRRVWHFLAVQVSQTIIKQRQAASNRNRAKYGRLPAQVDQEAPAY